VFKELVERLAQDVESGSVEWQWRVKREGASLGSDVSRQSQAQSLAGSSQAAREASPEPGAEIFAAEVETPRLALASDARPRGEIQNELSLVYEISAEQFPPAEIELAEDYSEPPETIQAQAPPTPERIDDAPLPYEARAEGRGAAAGGSAGRDFAGGETEDTFSSQKGGPAKAHRRKPKSAAPDSPRQPRLPRMD
jgi:hypothetical protein